MGVVVVGDVIILAIIQPADENNLNRKSDNVRTKKHTLSLIRDRAYVGITIALSGPTPFFFRVTGAWEWDHNFRRKKWGGGWGTGFILFAKAYDYNNP